jgi:hypothetical protein
MIPQRMGFMVTIFRFKKLQPCFLCCISLFSALRQLDLPVLKT